MCVCVCVCACVCVCVCACVCVCGGGGGRKEGDCCRLMMICTRGCVHPHEGRGRPNRWRQTRKIPGSWAFSSMRRQLPGQQQKRSNSTWSEWVRSSCPAPTWCEPFPRPPGEGGRGPAFLAETEAESTTSPLLSYPRDHLKCFVTLYLLLDLIYVTTGLQYCLFRLSEKKGRPAEDKVTLDNGVGKGSI
jgi:hypothetical protein